MKKSLFLTIMAMVLLFSVQAEADLFDRGTDLDGNKLIYDNDLDITWYDYTNTANTWQDQMDWASGLSVSGGDLIGAYDDWRLPTTVDGPYTWGYDGSTTAGYNITSSEMGHLFYAELENKGSFDTNGDPLPASGLIVGDFQNLQSAIYWSGTESVASTSGSWVFDIDSGMHNVYNQGNELYAIAVMSGDIAVVPEPVSTILFLTGGVILGFSRFRKKQISV